MRLSEDSFLGRRAIDFLAAYGAGRLAQPARRVLLSTMGGLGDGILLSSIIQHLRGNEPAPEIEVFARYGAAAALELLPDLPIHRGELRGNAELGLLATARHLRRRGYDVALATDQVALGVAATLILARIPRRIGFAPLRPSRQPRLYSEVVRLDESESQWRALVRLAQMLMPALPDSIEPLPLPIPVATAQCVADWRSRNVESSGPVVVFHLGAGAEYRRWPVDAFIALADRLRQTTPNMTLLLTGTEHELCEEFLRRYPGVALAFRKRTLGETAALLQSCDLLVANDSGIMHLGAAMGAPTVGLFGPNTPARWAPRGPHASAVYAGASCSPCIDNFRGPAPLTCVNPIRQECLRAISVPDVLAAVRAIATPWRV